MRMRRMFNLWNDHSAELEVHVEPWCNPYFVSRGCTIIFHYDAATESDATVTIELRGPDIIAVWFNSRVPPEAELDGKAVDPMWR
jgi:hypothetical protein